MLTSIQPCWEFEECTGYIIYNNLEGTGFKGHFRDTAWIYVADLMSEIGITEDSKGYLTFLPKYETVKVDSSIYINSKYTPPVPTQVTTFNYVEAYVEDDVIKKKANEELYQKYLDELPYPKPIYYLPFSVELDKGTKVHVKSYNGNMSKLFISLADDTA